MCSYVCIHDDGGDGTDDDDDENTEKCDPETLLLQQGETRLHTCLHKLLGLRVWSLVACTYTVGMATLHGFILNRSILERTDLRVGGGGGKTELSGRGPPPRPHPPSQAYRPPVFRLRMPPLAL